MRIITTTRTNYFSACLTPISKFEGGVEQLVVLQSEGKNYLTSQKPQAGFN